MDFRTFTSIIGSRWKIVVTAVVACLVGAVVVTAVQTRSYEASATVLVSFPGATTINDAYEGTQAAQQRLSSYAELAGGRTVAQRALEQVGGRLSAEDLVDNTEVSYTPESTVFRLTVTDANPDRAAALAAAMADQFAALVPEVDAGLVAPQQPPVIGDSLTALQPVVTAKATVVEPPTVPQDPVSPVPARNVALGLLAGVLLGIALAVMRNATDRTVRNAESLTTDAGLPVLAQLPETTPQEVAARRSRGRATPADLAFDEAIRGLRTRLVGAGTAGNRSVLVTAPKISEGASTTALSLALSFAETGETVLLVDGDPRQATVAGLLGLESRLGLSDVLADEQFVDDAVVPTSHAGLWMLGADTPNRSPRQVGLPALSAAMEKISANFDRLVIDGPPALVAAEVGVFAAAVDAAVLVVRSGHTTLDEVHGSLQNLRAADGQVAGVVLTAAKLPKYAADALADYRRKVGDTAPPALRASRT